MMRSRVILCILLSSILMVGCTDTKLEENMSKVEDNSSTYYSQYQSDFNKEVENLKNYEMNVILSLRQDYDWNYFRQGEFFEESQFEAKGVYSNDTLLSILGTTKESVLTSIESANEKLKSDGLVTKYEPTVDEKLAIADISVSYYLATTDNYESFGLSSNGIESSKNIMQVVTVVTDYGVYEGCFIWRDGRVIDAQEVNNF